MDQILLDECNKLGMMNSSSMSSSIISAISGCTSSEEANTKFYTALCKYIEENAKVYYSWSATMAPPLSTPDPQVILECGIKTSGVLKPSGETTPEGALSKLSQDLNQGISMWEVIWPTGFSINPAYIIPTITITQSKATNQRDAWESVCQEIINGLKKATPGPIIGTHGEYQIATPGATFIQIQ